VLIVRFLVFERERFEMRMKMKIQVVNLWTLEKGVGF
jgi:hypothetical protein